MPCGEVTQIQISAGDTMGGGLEVPAIAVAVKPSPQAAPMMAPRNNALPLAIV